MRLLAKTALALGLALSSAGAEDLRPRDLRRIHADIWNRGGVCRHAAAAVWEQAVARGHEVSLIYWSAGVYDHVIPVVKLGDKWCHVDSRETFRGLHTATTACRDSLKTDPRWLGIFSRRRARKGTVRTLEAPPISWIMETREFKPWVKTK